jgi:outer membrane protein assembly factor BamB
MTGLFIFLAIAHAANWPEWRGPDHNGMAQGDAPLKWSDTENIKWRAEIPGRGHSSPVIWGNKVFLTSAIPIGALPSEELRPPAHRRSASRRNMNSY